MSDKASKDEKRSRFGSVGDADFGFRGGGGVFVAILGCGAFVGVTKLFGSSTGFNTGLGLFLAESKSRNVVSMEFSFWWRFSEVEV